MGIEEQNFAESITQNNQQSTLIRPAETTQVQERRAKLATLREAQEEAFPNDFKRGHLAATLHDTYRDSTKEDLEASSVSVRVAGRMMLCRIMGKNAFVQLQDMSGGIQLYLQREVLTEAVYAAFKDWDLGDLLGAEGVLFRTKTGELSVKVQCIRLLAKALRPLPDKFHGLSDPEQRARYRYLDLLTNKKVSDLFKKRSEIITNLRRVLDTAGFLEVETPMMQPQAGGAAAKPFVTHHNAMHMELFLRIAPELYLKRLVVGGFEKVYEINRNFRNEGISTRHNPEFTMLEFYAAYADYTDFMDFIEQLLQQVAQRTFGDTRFVCKDISIDLSQPFRRETMRALLAEALAKRGNPLALLENAAELGVFMQSQGIALPAVQSLGHLHTALFEHWVEPTLIEPTFVTEFPVEVSPLARCKTADPRYTDRFELYVGGQELANGFSELNDPEEQALRFQAQLAERAAGDTEAMSFDADYIRALEHGLPPTAGAGIGIDRLVMLLTGAQSIREVILFPLLRPV